MTNFANFNTLQNGQSLFNYQEDGLRISINDTYFDWNPPGFDGSPMWYPNGGANELGDVTKTSGANFEAIDFQVSNGWSQSTTYVWVRVMNNGGLVADLDFDVTSGWYVGVSRGGFDQLFVAAAD